MTAVSLRFTASLPNTTIDIAKVTLNSTITILSVTYISGRSFVDDSLPDLIFTGNADVGDISFTLSNIGVGRAGLYSLRSIDSVIQCVTVYVLGE